MTRRIGLAALVFVWVCVGPARAQDAVVFVGTFQDWDVRTTQTPDGRICAARALHPEIGIGDILWAFNTARADNQPVGYLALDPRLLRAGDVIRVSIDDEQSFSLRPAADGYAYSEPADDISLYDLMREGLSMTVQIVAVDGSKRDIVVSLLGFTRATDAVRDACAGP